MRTIRYINLYSPLPLTAKKNGKMKSTLAKERKDPNSLGRTVKLLKGIIRNPESVHFLQDPQALTAHLELDPKQQIEIETALRHLSEVEPAFIRTYILEPFVFQFSDFCKRHPIQKRWPNFEELGFAFKRMTSSFLSENFITKRTKYYTLRRIVRDIPEWHEACRYSQKGHYNKQEQKTHYRENLSDLIEEYLVYLKEGHEEEVSSQTTQFKLFAEFFLALCEANDIPINPSLTIEVIKRFEKLNED